jgi:hypothetical protein
MIDKLLGGLTVFVMVVVLVVLVWVLVLAGRSGSGDQWQKCLDRGGVVILDRDGVFDGCQIGGRHG